MIPSTRSKTSKRPLYETYNPRGPLPAMYKVPDGSPIVYTICQIHESKIWRSCEFTGDRMHVVRSVTAGFLIGFARWAEDRDGLILFGVDPQGNRHPPGSVSNLESIRAYYRAAQ